MRKVIFAMSASFALLGEEAPDWFAKPKLDTISLYGFGMGSSIRVAKESAMVDLANSLQSSVKVFFQREMSRDDSNIASSASQRLSIDSKTVDFANIEPKKLGYLQDQCYALIEVSKN